MQPLENLTNLVEKTTIQGIVVALVLAQIAAWLTVPSVLLRRRGRPTSALLWLVVLLTMPPLGLLGWWLIGRTRIERKLRKHSHRKRNFAERRGAPVTERGTRFDGLLPPRAFEDHAFNSSDNHVTLLLDGKQAFSELERRLDEARESVHLFFYIFKNDETGQRICQRLVACQRRGAKVRVLLDGFGSKGFVAEVKRRLVPHGIEVAVFFQTGLWPLKPRMNFVNHRKIVTIDNRIGFTGGINIGNEYEHDWRDLLICVEGPAVMGLNHIFLEDWYTSTQQELQDAPMISQKGEEPGVDTSIISSGPDTEGWIHDAYFLAITQAKDRIYISTPYFIPTPSLVTALRTAAGRGVDVRLVLPSLSDVRLVMWASRSFYRSLILAGVRIFEYGAGMVHAKALVKDADVCCVGSANVDNRSFRLNFEISCFVADEKVTRELADWLEGLYAASHEVTAEELDREPLSRKLLESAAHLMSPLL